MHLIISRETIAPSFPSHVQNIVELMTEELEEKGHTVQVLDLHHTQEPEAQEIVEEAWQNACDYFQQCLLDMWAE